MPRGHTQGRTLTPLGELIIAYIRQRYPVLETRADFARICGLYASTLDNVMYSERHPSTRTLNKIINGTAASGYPMPANDIYTAARGIPVVTPTPPAPPAPPLLRDDEHHRPVAPRSASDNPERDPVYLALKGFLRQLQAQPMPDTVRQAILDSYLDSLRPLYPQMPSRPILSAWREQIWNEEHNHNFIETLELEALPAPAPPVRTVDADEPQPQPHSHPAGRHL